MAKLEPRCLYKIVLIKKSVYANIIYEINEDRKNFSHLCQIMINALHFCQILFWRPFHLDVSSESSHNDACHCQLFPFLVQSCSWPIKNISDPQTRSSGSTITTLLVPLDTQCCLVNSGVMALFTALRNAFLHEIIQAL